MPRRFSIVKLDPESANSLASTPDPFKGDPMMSEPPSGRQSSQVVINLGSIPMYRLGQVEIEGWVS
jgi:hypothetical protein